MNNKTIYRQSNNWLMMLEEKEIKKEATDPNTLALENVEADGLQQLTDLIPKNFGVPNFRFQIFPSV